MAKAKTKQQLTIENRELQARLQELEDTLEAIRSGAVDAIVASGPAGDRVYTLEGADHAYHTMVESMNEGAVTVLTNGTILYANRQFGQMTGASPSEIVGRPFHDFVQASDHSIWDGFIRQAGSGGLKAELKLGNRSASEISVQISATPIDLGGTKAFALVVTDLTESRRYEEIVSAERLSRYILEQSLEGVAVCIHGRILFASRRLHEICGCNPLMQPFDRLFPLRISERETFSVEIPQSGQIVRSTEASYQNQDGASYSLILNAGPLYGDDHQILGCLVSLTDITGRKRAEVLLQESEEKYRRLFENIRDLITVYEVERDADGRIAERRLRDGNPAFLRTVGVSSIDELRGKTASEVFGTIWAERHRAAVQEALDTGEALVHEVHLAEIDRDFITTIIPLDANTYIGTGHDITERKRAEERLQQSEERYRQLVDTAPDAIIVHRDGRCLFANEAALRLYGADDFEQLKSRNIVDLLHPDDRELTLTRIGQVQAGARTALREARLLRLNGQEVAVEAMAAPIHYSGQRAVQVILRDISLRKHAEESLRESERQLRQANELLEAVTTGTNVIIAAMDQAFHYTFFNKAYSEEIRRLTGRELRVGSSLEELLAVVPEQLEIALREWSRPLAGETVSKTIEFGDPGRQRRFYSTLQTPLRDADGQVVGAGEVAIDITDRVKAERDLQDSEARFRLLSGTAGRLLATGDPQGLVQELCRDVMEFLDCQAFFNFMVDERAGRLRLNTCAGIPEEEVRKLEWLDYGVAVCGCVARDGVRIVAEDIFHTPDVRTELVKSYGIQAYCCNPLKAQDRLIGTLSFGTKTRARFTSEEVELMRIVADQVAVAMQRVLAQQELRASEEALRLANEHLEQRVRARTMDLQNLAGELERSRGELRKLASELVMAEERERKRIAGVLHDEIAQTLAAARMRVDMIQGISSDQAERLKEAKALLMQSIRETRSLMNDLGNPLLFDMGLQAACESLAERLMRIHPVRIRCDMRDAYKRLDPDVKIMLYQLIRELLSNVVKHSQARNAHVAVEAENGTFRVKVTDDGVGFDPGTLGSPTAEGGFGLYSIRERLIAMDGTLRIESAPGSGTTVTAIVPATVR